MKNFLFLVFTLLLSSCVQNDLDFRNTNNNAEINIYLVKEGQLQIHSKDSEFNLEKLELEHDPWVRNSQIEFYDWSSHTFFLKTEKEKSKLSARHFVVVAGKKRLFAGVFFPLVLSSVPYLPSIAPEDNMFTPKDVIHFEQLGHVFTGNIESQSEFKEALTSARLIRNGIDVKLTGLKGKIPNSIEYTFDVINRDIETIYVLDPDKMDCNFQHYTNGVWLKKDNLLYFPTNSKMCPVIDFNNDWYFKLRPGDKMTRVVERQGFNQLISGKVTAYFSFPGAPIKKEGEWKKKDGRVWLGDFFIQTELMIQ